MDADAELLPRKKLYALPNQGNDESEPRHRPMPRAFLAPAAPSQARDNFFYSL